MSVPVRVSSGFRLLPRVGVPRVSVPPSQAPRKLSVVQVQTQRVRSEEERGWRSGVPETLGRKVWGVPILVITSLYVEALVGRTGSGRVWRRRGGVSRMDTSGPVVEV